MPRKTVSEVELLQWINAELAKNDDCVDCRVTSVMRLRDVDADGCNWSSANLRCSGRPVVLCQSVANEAIAQARLLFNIQ
jgi:hypothetical protein